MSVIVWDGKTIASDCSVNDGQVKNAVEKLWGRDFDICMGGVGAIHDVMAVKEWIAKGRRADEYPKVTSGANFVLVFPNRGLIRYTTSRFAVVHGYRQCAFGSGRDFALGAMFAGADAIKAVEAAIDNDPNCGKGVVSYRVLE